MLSPASPFAPIELRGESFGLSPTYWTFEDGKVLTFPVASDGVRGEGRPDAERIAALIGFLPPLDAEASLFHGVRRVPPGVMVTIDRTGKSAVTARSRHLTEATANPLDAANAMWSLVLASVRRAVRDSAHVAVLTGGGVDSSALLAAAIAVVRGGNDREVRAIALDFGGDGDDRPYLRDLERSLGVTAIRVCPAAGASDVRPLLGHSRMPVWAPGCASDLSLLRKARELGVDVVLAGIGGDDLFDGYPRLLGNDVARGQLGAAALAGRLEVPWRSSAANRISEFVARPLLRRALSIRHQRARRQRRHREEWSWGGPSFYRYIDAESSNWLPTSLGSPSERFEALARSSYVADSVELCDELARIASVRLAYPYLDEDLLELTSSLPPQVLLHADRLRGLFRLAIRGKIPDAVRLRRQKASFANARREMLMGAGGIAAFADLATMTKSAELSLVDPVQFRAVFEAFPREMEKDDTAWTTLWPALAIEGFLRARAAASRAS